MKYIAALVLLLTLGGCMTSKVEPPVVINRTIVISPPETLFNCPQIGKLPNWETLTNQQLADLIEKLYRYNKICKINMNAIEEYVAKAQAALDAKEPIK